VDDAVVLSERVTAERRRILGPAHPDTLVSRMGMALARSAAGDVVAALTLLDVALPDSEQAPGARNQHTIALRANVAACLAALGRCDEAVAAYRRAVDDSAELLGANHPDTVALHEEMQGVVQAPRKASSSSDSISAKRVEVISST
jgi:Tetratricopeptide repeat